MPSPFLIQPRFSLFLFSFFCVLYFVCMLFMFLIHMPLWLHFAVSIFLVVHCVYIVKRHVLYQHSKSISRLWCDENLEWKVQCQDSHVRSAKLLQSVLISRYYLFMTFQMPGRWLPLPVTLALDSDTSEKMRQLRLLLKTD